MNKHTPTPWKQATAYPSCIMTGYYPNHTFLIAKVVPLSSAQEDEIKAEADAAFIVKAVNCHDELVEALKIANDHINGKVNITGEGSIIIEQALAKAGV